jgi:TonB family protein
LVSGPTQLVLGRRRFLVAGAFALTLHAVLLIPARPTLIGGVIPETSPAMSVRVIAKHVVSLADPVPESVIPSQLTLEPARPIIAVAAEEARRNTAAAPAGAASASAARTARHVAAASAASTPEPGLPPAPAYLAGGGLDPGPRPLEEVEPVYPEDAKQQVGSVVLRLLINEAGAVDNVAVVRASPAGPFEKSALEAFGNAKFSPGRMLGVAVKSQITIEVLFTPINRGKVSGRSY